MSSSPANQVALFAQSSSAKSLDPSASDGFIHADFAVPSIVR